jgi:hypothetical protein
MRLTSFFPTSAYPSLDLYWYTYPIRAIHNGVHPFDHRFLQPGLCVRRLLCIALDHHLVVADEDQHGPWALVLTLPQESVCFFKYANRRGAKSAKRVLGRASVTFVTSSP